MYGTFLVTYRKSRSLAGHTQVTHGTYHVVLTLRHFQQIPIQRLTLQAGDRRHAAIVEDDEGAAYAVLDAVVTLTIELYRRKDAPFGVTDSWSVDGAVLRLSSDVLRGVRSQLGKYRSRRGIG